MSEWFHNGEILRAIDPDERGFQYGDGLFETIAIRHGEPRLWGFHLERLASGCKRLAIRMPEPESLTLWLDTALLESGVETDFCVAKVVVTSGVARRGYGRPGPAPPSTYIGVFPSAPLAEGAYHEGVDAMLCDTRIATGSPTAGLKTLNRIEQVLTRSECLASGAFEGLVFDADERLICGTMSNVFLVRNGNVVTPLLDRCGVRGVMRRQVMETLGETGGDVAETDLGGRDLEKADEVFLSNSQFGVVPVRRCDERLRDAGPVTRGVMRALAERGIRECRL